MRKRLLPFALLLVVLAILLLLRASVVEPVTTPAVTAAAQPSRSPKPEPTPTPTPTPEPVSADPAGERLARMSVEDKALQMILLCCNDPSAAAPAAARGVGGLCLYAASFAGKDAAGVIAMTSALQESAPIPLLLSVDEEGGTVCRVSRNPALRARPFAAPRTVYAAGGGEGIESDTAEKAQLLLSLGLNVNMVPVCDVPPSLRSFIAPRSFSTDAAAVSEYAARVVGVMREQGLGSVLKHFPGYGGSIDTHKGKAYDLRAYEVFEQRDFLPFRAGIEAGADAVLVSHNIVKCMDGTQPASLSPEVHRILREELGFEGVVLCDDLSMGAITKYTGGRNAAVQAVLAGNDLVCCGDCEAAAAAITAAVADGTIPEERLDESVLRILRWKLSLGLDISP